MPSLNKVLLIGNLGKDPEVRNTQGGSSVCNLTLATSERVKDRDGNWTYQFAATVDDLRQGDIAEVRFAHRAVAAVGAVRASSPILRRRSNGSGYSAWSRASWLRSSATFARRWLPEASSPATSLAQRHGTGVSPT